ncbi:MAG: hypothetical protein KatS3mg038_3650 [Candidatus Kapaibacterium sp.]|nr:MAG: hypothetical protein KatS3mg038_3650 [Candidatus Kapabacteria bacterium]
MHHTTSQWTIADTIPIAGSALATWLTLNDASHVVAIVAGLTTIIYTLARMYYLIKHQRDHEDHR